MGLSCTGVPQSEYQASDYYAALLRTRQDFVAPTQGKLLNYVQRIPLGVVAQITVRYSACRLPSEATRLMHHSHSTILFL